MTGSTNHTKPCINDCLLYNLHYMQCHNSWFTHHQAVLMVVVTFAAAIATIMKIMSIHIPLFCLISKLYWLGSHNTLIENKIEWFHVKSEHSQLCSLAK